MSFTVETHYHNPHHNNVKTLWRLLKYWQKNNFSKGSELFFERGCRERVIEEV